MMGNTGYIIQFEHDFDYMSFDTVKRTFSKLEKAGYLLGGNYNKDIRDKTK